MKNNKSLLILLFVILGVAGIVILGTKKENQSENDKALTYLASLFGEENIKLKGSEIYDYFDANILSDTTAVVINQLHCDYFTESNQQVVDTSLVCDYLYVIRGMYQGKPKFFAYCPERDVLIMWKPSFFTKWASMCDHIPRSD